MRRTVAAAAMAFGLLVGAAACNGGDDDDPDEGGRSSQEVCDDLDATRGPLETELQTGLQEVQDAAAAGDDAGAQQAALGMQGTVDELGQAYRDGAAEAEDPELSEAMTAVADELDALVADAAAGQQPDLTGVAAAEQRVMQLCDDARAGA